MNCYIELEGMHRFRDDVNWGMIMLRFRDGNPTIDDIRFINHMCYVGNKDALPEGITYACYRNIDRDAINTATFENHCLRRAKLSNTNFADDAVIILSDNLQIKKSNGTYDVLSKNGQLRYWTRCGEDDVKIGTITTRMDPALKLYRNCPVMLTHNENVADGKANGSRALVERVVLKVGETASTAQLSNGVNVSVVLASQVCHVELRHCNSRIVPSSFLLRAKEYTFDVKFPTSTAISSTTGNERELLGIKATQFPFISNTATTGHKLQGATIDKLFVHKWYFCRDGGNPSSRPSNWP